VHWRVLVPIKHAASAKTRLRAATREQARHAELVRAIQLDTLDAVLALRTHPLLGGLFVVSGPVPGHLSEHAPGAPAVALPAEIEILPDAGGGLNPALAAAAAELARRFPADGVVAMVGDLPALRAADLLAALQQAPAAGRSFVRDLDGSGTTLLAAGPRCELSPLFGPDSAQDLRRCLELGVGMLTSQLVADLV
jgi:2-phospho-L-lactate guanylyltransferase